MKTSKSAAIRPRKTSRPSLKKKAPKPKKASAGRRAKASKGPSQDEIALRAYYIAEERQKKGLPGSHEGDWLEAERQLRVEKH